MQSGMSRSRQTIASVVTAVIATLFALGLCELGLRLWDGIPLQLIDIVAHKATFVTTQLATDYDPLLGWRHRANLPGPSLVTGEYGTRMNSAEIKPLTSNAILAVGDSFTAGSEVDEHQTYSAQLETITGWPVINGGVGGYGTDQMILAAERFIPLLHPAMVVVGILDNDISRSGYRTYGGAPKPWFEVKPDGALVHHNNPVPPPVPRDQNGSAPWFAYSDLAIWTMGRLRGRSDLLAIRAELYEPANNDPVAVSCALLRRLQRTAEAEHIRLLVLMIYGGIDDISILERSFQRQQAVAVAGCARAANIETLDLWEELARLSREEPSRYRDLYHRYGPRQDGWGHMTAAGNALIARQIAQRLAARGWLAQSVEHVSVTGAASGGQ
jgi:lysophospholipase L1-like esterase